MNISKTAKQALIPIEREIMYKPIEHVYQLNNDATILSYNIGTADGAKVIPPEKSGSKFFILAHNHNDFYSFLSFKDIRYGIKHSPCEIRTTTMGKRIHLVEIPALTLFQKVKTLFTLNKYSFLYNSNLIFTQLFTFNNELYGTKVPWRLIRKMKKGLKKAGGLKFRTLKPA